MTTSRANPLHHQARPAVTRGARRRTDASPRGQAMVEFAAVLMPILLLLVGIIQFGFLFGANVTLTNAAREGARAGTIASYNPTKTRPENDQARCTAVLAAATNEFGMLANGGSHFSATDPCPLSAGSVDGGTWTNGDLVIRYCDHVTTPDAPCPDSTDPDTACDRDSREGCLIRVELSYRSDIIVPFIGSILGTGDQFGQKASATMVVN